MTSAVSQFTSKQPLDQLLQAHPHSVVSGGDVDDVITGLSLDSRTVTPGDAFFALKGDSTDGSVYIDNAIARGAVAVVIDRGDDEEPQRNTLVDSTKTPVRVVAVSDLRARVGLIADQYFNHPSLNMLVVAVTGTNGKTTCVWLLSQALRCLGRRCASLGTLGLSFEGRETDTGLTTPDAISVHKLFASLYGDGANALAMEASSHALAQHRLAGVNINIAVLTNVTHDHLDYHKTMDRYARAKIQLFTHPGLDVGIVNLDDPRATQFLSAAQCSQLLTFSISNPEADLHTTRCDLNASGMRLDMQTPAGLVTIEAPLVGRFNVSNLLAVAAVLVANNASADDISRCLSDTTCAPGRMEIFRSNSHSTDSPTVVVDYAHTPDALEKALGAVRHHCTGAIICVFGCGGDRDDKKRPQMGEIAERYADRVILTNDNPRGEQPELIVDAIKKGMRTHPMIILSRQAAIETAITQAREGDWVLVAGKGHETYQTIGQQQHHFSDRETVRSVLEVAP